MAQSHLVIHLHQIIQEMKFLEAHLIQKSGARQETQKNLELYFNHINTLTDVYSW